LRHVLPSGFQRIRYYGLLGNRPRAKKLAQCRVLLGMTPTTTTSVSRHTADYRDRLEALTGVSLRVCPVCHEGQMVATVVDILTQTTPAILNTS
jgi:YgiT-type zinc finger domain-containing protein